MMKTALVLLLSFSAATFAADPQQVKDPAGNAPGSFAGSPAGNPAGNPKAEPGEVKRLASVTWDLSKHKLVWVVEKGTVVNGNFVRSSEQKYEVSPDDAQMIVEQEQRGFDTDEASALQNLLDILSLYCAESVVWWEDGQGTPAGNTPPAEQTSPNAKPNSHAKPNTVEQTDKPVRVGQPEPKKPVYKVPASDFVAEY